MKKQPKYIIQKRNQEQEKVFQDLRKTHGDVLAHLYSVRNLNQQTVNLNQALEPFENLTNCKKAAAILFEFIQKKKKICIVSDYDADGATACSIGLLGLRMFNANVEFIVPNRFIHGYGLTPSVIDEAIEKCNPDLLITVDNGISSIDGVNYATSKNIPVLVTDHHLVGDELPDALCIVNPNLPNCNFKSKSLAGCGVIFYVLCALRQHYIEQQVYDSKNAPNVFSLLDLVAIGTIADVVFLDLNNRLIVSHGLRLIHNYKTRPGILALIDVCKKQYHNLNSMDIGFYIGPRINAAGRLEDMTIGIKCLTSDNCDEAILLAQRLHEINSQRKAIESEMKEISIANDFINNKFSKISYHDSYHEGVIGILASRLKDAHYLPTIVFADSHDENLIKGSGRSIPQIHLRDAIDYVYKKSSDIIVKFGGHSAAAGLTIYKEKLGEFSKLFDEAVEYYSYNQNLENIKMIDLELQDNQINLDNAEIINKQIWGQGLPSPIFKSKFTILSQKILKEAHLKLNLEIGSTVIDGIWFFKNDLLEQEEVELIYSLSINEFNNSKSVQILIEGVV